MVEADIAGEHIEDRVKNRTALKKYLGKVMTYSARFGTTHSSGQNAFVIYDVTLHGKNKVLADHLWVSGEHNYKQGDIITFRGVVTTYKDNSGERKYRIARIK